MCIGIWTLEHPEYALILCTNRDEYLVRPTQDAHFHSFGDEVNANSPGQILSGRDVQAGGSWFGINRSGRVSLLTNITEPVKKYNTSRGSLVSSFLQSDSPRPLDEIGKIIPMDGKFAGFNLFLLAPTLAPDNTIKYDSLYVTNHGGGGTLTSRPLRPDEVSCGGLSNGIDGAGAELWLKVQHATKEFEAILQTLTPNDTESELTDRLFKLLAWHPPEAILQRSELRNTVQVTPVPIILEGSRGENPGYYGTRLSTVLLVKRNGDVLFIERDIWKLVDGAPARADPSSERRFEFKLDIKSTINNN
ncbi:NRDE protein-domain-containing protein [Gymnopilus junonius]|uniref:NRDE protein-domain-containing protein n=1 Tax=Gymnopilus junonius TaxID=109634 RepID=A0A9P5NIZ2_GYMJU|nr:NRDE protein-domain-containing protein [Gymnopilus junonius]